MDGDLVPQPLKLDPTLIQASAGQLEAATAAAKEQLARNARALTEGQSGFAGGSFAAFEQLRETWDRDDADRASRLEDISTNLRRSASAYQHADEASATSIDFLARKL